MNHHLRELGRKHSDTVVIITHGLTMRLLLMQLYRWSPKTFHSVWNADNCEFYVLKHGASKKNGRTPFTLDENEGYFPRSSVTVLVFLRDGTTKELCVNDYIKLPPPRTRQVGMIKEQLREQFGIRVEDIEEVVVLDSGSSSKGVAGSGSAGWLHCNDFPFVTQRARASAGGASGSSTLPVDRNVI